MSKKNIYARKGVNVRISKDLQNLADEAGVRIKPIIRDELERIYRANIYESLKPESTGTYSHRGHKPLASKVHAVIDGDIVKAQIEDDPYPDEKGREITYYQVYKWLTRGTRRKAKSEYYPIESNKKKVRTYTRTINRGQNKGQTIQEKVHWAKYTPTPIHTFNQDSIKEMKSYIRNELIPALESEKGKLYEELVRRYKNKRV